MPREYVPLPMEYRVTMDLLSDEDFGRLVRALLDYAAVGTPIALDGDARFYSKSVMLKDDYYAKKCAEEEAKAAKRSRHASVAATAKHEQEAAGNQDNFCQILPEQTKSNHIISNQNKTNQIKSVQINSSCSELNLSSEPEEAPVVKIPLNDKSEYPIYQRDIEKWQAVYQAVDVMDQVQRMPLWFEANPAKKKTAKGILRFINSWLAKEQDHGGAAQAAGGRKQGAGEKKAPTLTEFD